MSVATTESRNDLNVAQLRLQLLDQGWKSLTPATDPRLSPGPDGAAITVAYFPEFRGALGVPSGMVRPGRHELPDRAAFGETYVRLNSSWNLED